MGEKVRNANIQAIMQKDQKGKQSSSRVSLCMWAREASERPNSIAGSACEDGVMREEMGHGGPRPALRRELVVGSGGPHSHKASGHRSGSCGG